MRSVLTFLPILVSTAAAQVFDFDAIAAAPPATLTGPPVLATAAQTSVYNGAAAASSAAAAILDTSTNDKRAVVGTPSTNEKRDVTDPCAPQPSLYGPLPLPNNTVEDFENSQVFQAVALSADVVPGNYYEQAFLNYNGSMTGAGYMGFMYLETYNLSACASMCTSTQGCLSFNIFYERDPSLNPADACPNPAAGTAIKCSIWGVPATEAAASNYGQYREQFEVVIAGSNAYNVIDDASSAPIIPGFDPATVLPAAINNAAVYLSAVYYNQPYDPSVCSAACNATTTANMQAAVAAGNSTYEPCNYFNSFVLSQDGVATGMYCSLYSTEVDATQATTKNVNNNGKAYGVSNSLGYAHGKQMKGVVGDD